MLKSSIFYADVDIPTKTRLHSILPIPEGSLPGKYLGVPLISSRSKVSDCSQLRSKILSRIQSWSNKSLTYGGRVQLVNSVLFSIQVYWASIFMLPQKVVQDLEQLLRAFLWSGSELKHSGAKVSWKDICVPKEEGGLGFKLMKDWNRASMNRHLRAVCKKSDTLWVKWVHIYIILETNVFGL